MREKLERGIVSSNANPKVGIAAVNSGLPELPTSSALPLAQGRKKLDKASIKVPIKAPIKWTDQLAEELHKPVIKKFRKRRVYVKGIDQIFAADFK